MNQMMMRMKIALSDDSESSDESEDVESESDFEETKPKRKTPKPKVTLSTVSKSSVGSKTKEDLASYFLAVDKRRKRTEQQRKLSIKRILKNAKSSWPKMGC